MTFSPPRNYSLHKRKTYGRYRVRCRYCKHRRTFTKLPEFYIRPHKCACTRARKARTKGVSEWVIDWHRTARFESKATTCGCLGFPYPHRRKSASPAIGAECDHYKRAA